MLVDHWQKKQRKNTKIQRKRRLEIYLSEQTRQGLFSTQYMYYYANKDLPKRTPSDKVLCDKAFGIANNSQ